MTARATSLRGPRAGQSRRTGHRFTSHHFREKSVSETTVWIESAIPAVQGEVRESTQVSRRASSLHAL